MRPLLLLIASLAVGLIGYATWQMLRPVPMVPETGLDQLIERLRPIHSAMGPPQPNDWLTSHDEEGQSFAEYLLCNPNLPTDERGKLYVLPLGDFTDGQQQVFDKTVEFLGLYFTLPVVTMEALSLDVIPPEARREHPSWGMDQILSTYVLYDVMKPRLPDDAAAALVLTATDLWPGRGWNFVFGQASLKGRVGVWSIYRNGDPDESRESFRLCLLRTLKTATHETGHMFSIKHCIAYECNMCGSNHREESDRRPIALCPECVSKIVWACDADVVERYRGLAEFCEREGLDGEAKLYRRSLQVLGRDGGG